jgi:hypothetical protein
VTEVKPTMDESSKFARHSDIENFKPQKFEDLLGPAPAAENIEDADEYESISHSVLEGIRPTNYIEQLFVVDLIDVTFEIANLRHVMVSFKAITADDGIEACLIRTLLVDTAPGHPQAMARLHAKIAAKPLAKRWREDVGSRDEIEEHLRTKGISDAAMEVEIFLQSLPTLEVIEKRLFSAQKRRNALLREVWLHRELAKRARLVSDKVIENMPKLLPKQE